LVLKFLALSLEIQGPSPDLFHYYLSLLLAWFFLLRRKERL
jgi:hypothetical protein